MQYYLQIFDISKIKIKPYENISSSAPPKPVYFLLLVFITADRKSSQIKKLSRR